ncbi:hypothetical protein SESBI_24691, partial [Sesbania bispinosa]
MKDWNQLVFGNIFQQKKTILRRLEGIDRKLLEGPNSFLTNSRVKLWTDYEAILAREEEYRLHQSRVNWLNLRDKNTHFYHQATVIRMTKNRIEALQDDNQNWVFEDDKIQLLMLNFFKGLLVDSSLSSSSTLEDNYFPILDLE